MRVAVSVVFSLKDNLLSKRIETAVSAVNSTIAFAILPTAELSLPANFSCPGFIGGVSKGGDHIDFASSY